MRRLIGVVLACLMAMTQWAGAFGEENVRISVPGGDEGLLEKVTTASLVQQAVADERTAPDELLAAARAEYRQLLGTLYGEGYYSPVINVRIDGREAADISPLSVPSRIGAIEIVVQPGDAFRFGQVEIAPLAPNTELPEGFKSGEPARVNTIQRAASVSVRAWRDIGHAKVEIANEDITADHARDLISARIGLKPGPELRFGELRVSGNKRVRTDRIRVIAGLPVGEVYSPEELEDAADRLRRTEAFRAVSLKDGEQIQPGNVLPIDAVLVEEKRRRLGAGVEISSLEGLRLSAFWLHRNLLGGAERLRFDAEIEDIGARDERNGVDYRLRAFFRRPAAFGTDYDLYIFGQLQREDEPGYLSDTVDIGAGVTRIFSDTLEGSIGGLYRAARVEDAFGKRDYQLFGLPVDLTWDTRDDELDARSGFYVRGQVQPFVGINGIESGALVELDARAYRPVGERIVLAGWAQLGSLFGPEVSDAPPDYLFFAGGGGSVRGQPYQSLGTGEIDDTIIGGRSYLALSGEVRAQVRGPLGLVGFYDAGYVGEEEFYDGSGEWIAGAGLGVRYDTGFGPLRVDIATPVQGGPDDADDVQLYIGIGQAF